MEQAAIQGTELSPTAKELLSKIESRTACVAVVGLGYVGLPMLHALHQAGFPTIGYDSDATKIEKLQRGENYLKHLGAEMTETLSQSDRFRPTGDPSLLSEADAIVLCVPSPLGAISTAQKLLPA